MNVLEDFSELFNNDIMMEISRSRDTCVDQQKRGPKTYTNVKNLTWKNKWGEI